jgi:hypothetical protein
MKYPTIVRLLPALSILAACDPFPAAQAASEPTRVDVHVVARDAKLVGSAVGGAQVTIRDAESGEVLAEGVHEGGTGDTGLIMGTRERNAHVFTTPGAAVYTAELALDAPRMVTVEATGPLDFPQARTTASTTLLVMPGEDVTGDGVVLELWGYIVEILGTPAASASGSELPVRARVRMLCSCPTQPGGLWDAPAVRARLTAPDGTVVAETALAYEGGNSTYGGSLAQPGTGEYELEVRAVSAETGNTGRTSSAVRVP